jgi:hypothetical protein
MRRSFTIAALARECGTIRHQVEALLKRSSEPTEIWRVHDYLSEKRREIAQKYDRRLRSPHERTRPFARQGLVDIRRIAPLKQRGSIESSEAPRSGYKNRRPAGTRVPGSGAYIID